MQKLILFICISLFVTNVSQSQVNAPPLSSEETEVVKPFERIVESWHKKDVELWMSAYHEKAIIELTAGGKMGKGELRRYFRFGKNAPLYKIEKINIFGDKATVECTLREGERVIPMRFDLIKEEGAWLIIYRKLL